MKVLIVFDPAYGGEVADAVWIVDSPANRRWISDHREKLHPNSAVFFAKAGQAVAWDVQEHHPDWTEIEAVGLILDEEVLAAITEEGSLTPTAQGLRLLRR